MRKILDFALDFSLKFNQFIIDNIVCPFTNDTSLLTHLLVHSAKTSSDSSPKTGNIYRFLFNKLLAKIYEKRKGIAQIRGIILLIYIYRQYLLILSNSMERSYILGDLVYYDTRARLVNSVLMSTCIASLTYLALTRSIFKNELNWIFETKRKYHNDRSREHDHSSSENDRTYKERDDSDCKQEAQNMNQVRQISALHHNFYDNLKLLSNTQHPTNVRSTLRCSRESHLNLPSHAEDCKESADGFDEKSNENICDLVWTPSEELILYAKFLALSTTALALCSPVIMCSFCAIRNHFVGTHSSIPLHGYLITGHILFEVSCLTCNGLRCILVTSFYKDNASRLYRDLETVISDFGRHQKIYHGFQERYSRFHRCNLWLGYHQLGATLYQLDVSKIEETMLDCSSNVIESQHKTRKRTIVPYSYHSSIRILDSKRTEKKLKMRLNKSSDKSSESSPMTNTTSVSSKQFTLSQGMILTKDGKSTSTIIFCKERHHKMEATFKQISKVLCRLKESNDYWKNFFALELLFRIEINILCSLILSIESEIYGFILVLVFTGINTSYFVFFWFIAYRVNKQVSIDL